MGTGRPACLAWGKVVWGGWPHGPGACGLGRWAEATDIFFYPRPCGSQASPRSTGNLLKSPAVCPLILTWTRDILSVQLPLQAVPHPVGGLQTKGPRQTFPSVNSSSSSSKTFGNLGAREMTPRLGLRRWLIHLFASYFQMSMPGVMLDMV